MPKHKMWLADRILKEADLADGRVYKKITPGVNGVLIGFGFFGNLWFSENRILLVFLCGYWIDDVKVRRRKAL